MKVKWHKHPDGGYRAIANGTEVGSVEATGDGWSCVVAAVAQRFEHLPPDWRPATAGIERLFADAKNALENALDRGIR